jgi:hypothetical protein
LIGRDPVSLSLSRDIRNTLLLKFQRPFARGPGDPENRQSLVSVVSANRDGGNEIRIIIGKIAYLKMAKRKAL